MSGNDDLDLDEAFDAWEDELFGPAKAPSSPGAQPSSKDDPPGQDPSEPSRPDPSGPDPSGPDPSKPGPPGPEPLQLDPVSQPPDQEAARDVGSETPDAASGGGPQPGAPPPPPLPTPRKKRVRKKTRPAVSARPLPSPSELSARPSCLASGRTPDESTEIAHISDDMIASLQRLRSQRPDEPAAADPDEHRRSTRPPHQRRRN